MILDEVGRGVTATHDGLSIAQACMEYLHDVVGCRTLFATHFHELAEAAEAMPNAVCMTMDASAGRHDEMFAYKVKPGQSGRSYGLRSGGAGGHAEDVVLRKGSGVARSAHRPDLSNPCTAPG